MRLLVTTLLAIFVALPVPAGAQGAAGEDLRVQYLDSGSFAAASRSSSPIVSARKTRKSVRYFTGGQALALDPDTRSIDFGGAIGTVEQTDAIERAPDDFTWIGHSADGARAVIVVQGGRLTGSIAGAAGSYEIVPAGGAVHALIEQDPAAFPPEHPPGPLPRATDRPENGPKAEDAAADGAVIDVLIAYSTAAKNAQGGSMQAFAQLAIDTANTAYADSGVTARLRLAGTIETHYAGTDFNQALSDLTNGAGGLGPVVSRRNALGADLVSLFFTGSAYCGLAWLNSTVDYAYSVVNWTCAIGNQSFAHELGHNYGSRHDPFVDPQNTPFPYGHGFVKGNSWRTIMAYADACGGSCPRIGRFSTPRKTYLGAATGTAATHDNARVHNQRGAVLAAFKAGPGQVLRVTRKGYGDGTVNSTPGGIRCGATCRATFADGATVTLRATAASGSVFAFWGGACKAAGTASTCRVRMDAAKSVTAVFNSRSGKKLSVLRIGNRDGIVTAKPVGILCGSACNAYFPGGTRVKLTATPKSGSVFTGWSGACSGTTRSCTVTLSVARTVKARFVAR